MRKSNHRRLIPALATLAAASLTTPQASTTTGASGTSPSAPMADTAYSRPYRDSGAGGAGIGAGSGTGIGRTPGLGGSSLDSAYGRDTLWSSPENAPATPGTGLPNSPGSGWPATGGSGTGGTGGKGTGGSGMGGDTAWVPPTAPGTVPALPATPHDSIGAPDWMERG
jgi:hypothetical protein